MLVVVYLNGYKHDYKHNYEYIVSCCCHDVLPLDVGSQGFSQACSHLHLCK